VLRKASRKNAVGDVPDVPADDPVGTMERFTKGLRRVLSVSKKAGTKKRLKLHRRQT
jgi:hypothetical protein